MRKEGSSECSVYMREARRSRKLVLVNPIQNQANTELENSSVPLTMALLDSDIDFDLDGGLG